VQISAALCEAFAAAAGEERCADLLRRVPGLEDREVSWGMMGLVDLGPFAGVLAVLAAAAGDASGALAFFEKALSRAAERGLAAAEVGLRAERATLLGWIGRAAEAAAERGRAGELAAALDMEPTRVLATREALGLAPRPAPAPAARPAAAQPPSFSLVREGDVWAVSHAGSTFRVRHGRGVEMLASLVASPERAFHCTELDLPAEAVAEALGDAGEVLDARARDAYRRRAGELQAELAEAEEFHDAGRADRARGELEALAGELARGAGLGGRTRRAGSQVERSRVNVQRRLKDAIQRIGGHDPALGRHLERAVRTGTFCAYRP
jgi:non-specific serine/threonine protein kinase